MKKDGLIITRETVLGHLLFILRKLEHIEETLIAKNQNKLIKF